MTYIINNKELLIAIIKLSHILLFGLFLYLNHKFLNFIYLRIFKIDKQKLDILLSSFNKDLLSIIIKLSYALSFFIALALAIKIPYSISNLLFG